jgi:hypothetical protein
LGIGEPPWFRRIVALWGNASIYPRASGGLRRRGFPLTVANPLGHASLASNRSRCPAYVYVASWKNGGHSYRNGAWEHEYLYTALPITVGSAQFHGSATLFGPSEGHDSSIVNAGLAVQWSSRVSTYVGYQGQLGRDRYNGDAVTGYWRRKFQLLTLQRLLSDGRARSTRSKKGCKLGQNPLRHSTLPQTVPTPVAICIAPPSPF